MGGWGVGGGEAYITTDARLSALSSTGGAQIAVSEKRAGQENPFLLRPPVKMCYNQCNCSSWLKLAEHKVQFRAPFKVY